MWYHSAFSIACFLFYHIGTTEFRIQPDGGNPEFIQRAFADPFRKRALQEIVGFPLWHKPSLPWIRLIQRIMKASTGVQECFSLWSIIHKFHSALFLMKPSLKRFIVSQLWDKFRWTDKQCYIILLKTFPSWMDMPCRSILPVSEGPNDVFSAKSEIVLKLVPFRYRH